MSCQKKKFLLSPCARPDTRLHPGLDLELVFSLNDECSVTRVATEVVWYSSHMKWSKGGESGRVFGGGTGWLVGCVCGRGLYGGMFGNGWFWVILMEFYGVGEWMQTRLARQSFPWIL